MPPRTRKQHQTPPLSQALPRPMVTRSSRPQRFQHSSQPVSMPPPPGLGGMEMPPPSSHTEGEKAPEELKRNIVEYRAFLKSCDFIEANTQWRKVQDRLEDDERCSRLDKTDRLAIFQEYIHDLEKEEEQNIQKEQLRQKERKNRDEFRRLMADHKATGLLTAKTHWLDYCAKVKDHLAYLAVASNTSGPPPKDLFEDVAEEMKKQYQEDKANIKDALKAGKFTVTSAWTLDKFKAFIGGVYDLAAVSKTNLELVFEEVLEQAKEKEEKEAKKRQMLADNFMNLLYSAKEIVASSKWEDCVPLLKDAQVYRAISDESFRREIFDEYVKHLQEKVKEKEHKQDEEKLVFEEVIEQTRKKEEKEAKKRKRLADDFMDFLHSEKEIVASSKWKDCIPLLEDAQEYRAISDESFRQQIFDEYIAHFQEKVEQKKCKCNDEKDASIQKPVQIGIQIAVPSHQQHAQITTLQGLVQQLQGQVTQLQAQVATLTIERDTTVQRYGQVKALVETLEQTATLGFTRNSIRAMVYDTRRAEYYRGLYYQVVPLEQRAPSFSKISKATSQQGHTESRGAIGSPSRDPDDPDAGPSWANIGLRSIASGGGIA